MRVVLLDDAAIVRERLVAELAAVHGVDVVARDACGADLDAGIHELHPDVVVVDVHAPRAMGVDLIRRLRSGDSHPVVIALSSCSSFRYRSKCHEAGATYYFDKVREQDRLVEAIAELSRELA